MFAVYVTRYIKRGDEWVVHLDLVATVNAPTAAAALAAAKADGISAPIVGPLQETVQ